MVERTPSGSLTHRPNGSNHTTPYDLHSFPSWDWFWVRPSSLLRLLLDGLDAGL